MVMYVTVTEEGVKQMKQIRIKHRRTILSLAFNEYRMLFDIPDSLAIPKECEYLKNIEKEDNLKKIIDELRLRNGFDIRFREVEDVQESLYDLLKINLVKPDIVGTTQVINSLIQLFTLDAICNDKKVIIIPTNILTVYLRYHDDIYEIINNHITLTNSYDKFTALMLDTGYAEVFTSIALNNIDENPSLSILTFYLRFILLHYAILVYLIETYEM